MGRLLPNLSPSLHPNTLLSTPTPPKPSLDDQQQQQQKVSQQLVEKLATKSDLARLNADLSLQLKQQRRQLRIVIVLVAIQFLLLTAGLVVFHFFPETASSMLQSVVAASCPTQHGSASAAAAPSTASRRSDL